MTCPERAVEFPRFATRVVAADSRLRSRKRRGLYDETQRGTTPPDAIGLAGRTPIVAIIVVLGERRCGAGIVRTLGSEHDG